VTAPVKSNGRIFWQGDLIVSNFTTKPRFDNTYDVCGTSATYSIKLIRFREYTSGIVIENTEFVAVVCTVNMGCTVRNSSLEGQRFFVGRIGEQGLFWLRALALHRVCKIYCLSKKSSFCNRLTISTHSALEGVIWSVSFINLAIWGLLGVCVRAG